MSFNPLFAASLFSGSPHPPQCAVMLATQSAGEGWGISNGWPWMASRSFRPTVAGRASSALIVVSEHARKQLPGAVAALLGRTRGPLLEPQPQRRHASLASGLREQQLGLLPAQRTNQRSLGALALATRLVHGPRKLAVLALGALATLREPAAHACDGAIGLPRRVLDRAAGLDRLEHDRLLSGHRRLPRERS